MRELVSLQAEQATIGAILVNPSCAVDVFEIVRPADFADPMNHKIITAVQAFTDNDKPLDSMILCQHFADCGEHQLLDYILDLTENSASSANVKTYARVVRDRAMYRRLLEVSASIGALAHSDDIKTPEEAIQRAQAMLLRLEEGGVTETEAHEINALLKRCVENLDRRFRMHNSGQIDGLSTGFFDIDRRWGGMRPGQFIVIAARPSMGKSAYAMQICQFNAERQKKHVLVCSLEMTGEQLTERMLASIGGINYKHIQQGSMQEGDWPLLSNAVGRLKGCPMEIIDTGGMHINQIRSSARRIHRRSAINLLMVDHISLAAGDGENRTRELSTITSGLKNLAKELRCPVIGLCQLNRDCEKRPDKRPRLSDLRESGTIEQDADIIQFLYRDEYYNPEKSHRKGIVELLTKKFRDGEVGDDFLVSRLDQMRLENCTFQIPDDPGPTEEVFHYKKRGR